MTGGDQMPPGEDLPVDEVTRAFWDATRDRRLVVQHCASCGHWQHYPRALCTRCGTHEPPFAEVSGRAIIDSYTEVHRAPEAGLAVPYVIARVRLAEGPVLLTRIVDGVGRADLIDQPVSVAWEPVGDGRHLPVFRLSQEN